MSEYTLQQYIDQAAAQFNARSDGSVQQTGLELCRLAAVLATGLMSNSPAAQREALVEAKVIANERESVNATDDSDVDEQRGEMPREFTEIALRLIAVENQTDRHERYLHQLAIQAGYRPVTPESGGTNQGGAPGDAEAHPDG